MKVFLLVMDMKIVHFLFGLFTSTVFLLPVFGSGELDPNAGDVNEGPCKNPPPAKDFKTKINDLYSEPSVYGVYLASQSNLRAHAATFLGKPAQKQEEIDKMCLRLVFGAGVAIHEGYGEKNYINFGDISKEDGVVDYSTHLAHTPGVETKYEKTIKETVVWSDGSEHLLIVRCINNKIQDWQLLSKSEPKDDVKTTVLTTIESLGFKKQLAVDSKKTGGACPPLKTRRQFSGAIQNNFRNSASQSTNSDSNEPPPLKKRLETPIKYKKRNYSTLYFFITDIMRAHAAG